MKSSGDIKKKKISKNVRALSLVSFFNDSSSEMIYPLIPIFLSSVLGASVVFIGLIEGVAEGTASLWKLFSGYLSDRLKKRKILVNSGYTLSSVIRPLIGITTASWQVLFIRFFDRTGKGIRTSPRDALIADSTAPENRGLAFGFHRSMDHLGAVAGPLIAIFLLYLFNQNLRKMFLFSAIPAFICLIILFVFVKEISPAKTEQAHLVKLSLKPFSSKFRFYLLILFVFTLSNSSDAFLILRAENLGISISLIPLLWIVLHISKTLFSTPGGWLSDHLGRQKVLALGFFIYSFVYLGLALANQSSHVWVAFIVYGLYFGLIEGTEKALIADIVDDRLRGTAYGLYHFIIGISIFPASLFFGFIWKYINPPAAFIFGSLLSIIALVMVLFLNRFAD